MTEGFSRDDCWSGATQLRCRACWQSWLARPERSLQCAMGQRDRRAPDDKGRPLPEERLGREEAALARWVGAQLAHECLRAQGFRVKGSGRPPWPAGQQARV